MQIQFDPFSFGVAVIAVAISAWALYSARKAPSLERVRQNRDIVRAVLRSADAKLSEVSYRLDEGLPVPSIPDEIDAAFETLKEYGPRLPEDDELLLLATNYFELRRSWRAADHQSDVLGSRQSAVSDAEARVGEVTGTTKSAVEQARENLSSARRREGQAQMALASARTALREMAKLARAKSLDYTERLDAADRSLK